MSWFWFFAIECGMIAAKSWGKKEERNFMEKKTALSEEKKQWLIVAAIMLVGILVRLLLVGRYPAGLNQDEASAGYDAFAVLNYGIDRNGIHNPMHLIAWGSGQNMAYSWLCMPFIALFGLSAVTVRVPMAIVGSISVALFYFFLKNIRGEDKRLVYLGTFLFAVFPWHIMKSRWGLESNLFPDMILWGVVLLSFFLRNRKGIFLYFGYFLFGFSAYAYGSAYCFLPFFVLPLTVYLYCTKRAELRQLFLAMLILAVVVLPVLVFLFINTFDYPQIDLGLFTIPRLYANRHTEMASVFSGDFLAKSWRNFTGALKILAVQDDGLPWNAIRYFGLTYPITLPLTLWGLFVSLRNFRRRNETGGEFLMDFWLLSSVVLLFVVEPNINRINIIMIPWMYYTAVGTTELARNIRGGVRTAAAVYGVFFLLFVGTYFTRYQATIGYSFFEGLGDAIVHSSQENASRIYVTDNVNQPYIFALFYNRTDPNLYRNTVQYKSQYAAFEEIAGFDKYVFGIPETIDPTENAVYVFGWQESSQFPETEFEITRWGCYSVAVPKRK